MVVKTKRYHGTMARHFTISIEVKRKEHYRSEEKDIKSVRRKTSRASRHK
jgi:hypothetical protein